MKDFKQTTKMKAQGSHYCGGGKVKKYAEGGDVTEGQNANIGDDVRSRAMAAMAKREQDIGGGGEEQPVVVAKKVVKKTATKLPMPDYSNEDLDRMGLNDDTKPVTKKLTLTESMNARPSRSISKNSSRTGYKTGGKVKRGAKK
jgi:hypothetical protein